MLENEDGVFIIQTAYSTFDNQITGFKIFEKLNTLFSMWTFLRFMQSYHTFAILWLAFDAAKKIFSQGLMKYQKKEENQKC